MAYQQWSDNLSLSVPFLEEEVLWKLYTLNSAMTMEEAEDAPIIDTALDPTSTTVEEEPPMATAAAMTKKEESPMELATTTLSSDMKRNTDGPSTTTQLQTNIECVLEDDLSNEE
jgi:hypothetical protein